VNAVRVVGVAVLRDVDGRRLLLAARRAEVAGVAGWELPGGKCEPGEDLESAAVREIREELGCEVRVLERLDRVQEIRPGLSLEVVVAAVLAGEPRPLEHAELRWLAAGDLGSVTWLPADVPFLADLRPRLTGPVGGAT
jgi:8-oxo-dGTP diphosphatase